ncbi:MAG: Na+/H+ antiporter subunit E [Pseudomonadota bacterium]
MSKAVNWLFPHPFLTILLVVVWILLQNQVSAGMVVFGLILGIIIPRITAVWWPDKPQRLRIGKLFVYMIIVLWDIIVANIEVGWIVVTKPNSKLRSAWVVVPLDLKTPEAISMLAGTVTLTPGTISADLSDGGRCLLVHALDTDNVEAVRDQIKQRYERRLMEIFA